MDYGGEGGEGREDAPVERLLIIVRREAKEGADTMYSMQSIIQQFDESKVKGKGGQGRRCEWRREGGKRHARHASEGEARFPVVEAVETLKDGQDRPVGHR
jgi:hypothetical protein